MVSSSNALFLDTSLPFTLQYLTQLRLVPITIKHLVMHLMHNHHALQSVVIIHCIIPLYFTDPNDILVLSELNSPPTQSPPTLPPTPSPPPRRRPFPPPLIDRPSPNYGDRLPHPVRRRKRVSTLPVSGRVILFCPASSSSSSSLS